MATNLTWGLHRAVVIGFDDPLGANRVKIRIPKLHGPVKEDTYCSLPAEQRNRLTDEELPWATLCLPFGSITLPQLYDVVWITYYGGDTSAPIIVGWTGNKYIEKGQIC